MSPLAVHPNVLWISLGLFAALVAGTLVRLSVLRGEARERAQQHLDSLKTWWLIAILVVLCAVGGLTAAVLLLAVASGLALREYLHLLWASRPDRGTAAAAYLLTAVNYLLVWLAWLQAFAVFLPLAGTLLLSCWRVCQGRTDRYVHLVAGTAWGLLVVGYGTAHAAVLFQLPAEINPIAGGAGLFLYLLILSEGNDIAQALFGRSLGKRQLTPRVSPRKTWEGLIGGIGSTALLAVLLAPWLTPFGPLKALAAGLLIALSGSLGDLNMSAVKREAGAGDSGKLLPGQGGMLDRIDSLTFAAPAFYYFVLLR